MDNINHFYKKAKVFCNFLEKNEKFELDNSQTFILKLLDIYSLALELPDVEPDTAFIKDANADNLSISFGKK